MARLRHIRAVIMRACFGKAKGGVVKGGYIVSENRNRCFPEWDAALKAQGITIVNDPETIARNRRDFGMEPPEVLG